MKYIVVETADFNGPFILSDEKGPLIFDSIQQAEIEVDQMHRGMIAPITPNLITIIIQAAEAINMAKYEMDDNDWWKDDKVEEDLNKLLGK